MCIRDRVKSFQESITENSDLIYNTLKSIPGIEVAKPEGTFMIYAQFDKYLEDKGMTIDELQKKGVKYLSLIHIYCVIKAEEDFYTQHNANPLRGSYPLSVEATDIYENSRIKVQKFINAASNREIIFTRNSTESLNPVSYTHLDVYKRQVIG